MYASEIGIDTIFNSDELLDHIYRLPISEVDKARLRYWTPVEKNGPVLLAGQVFRRNEFRWSRRLECRECVTETPYHRVWWHLECFRTCPVHRCPLEPILHERNSFGRWWPRFNRAVEERSPDVELGEAKNTFESYIIRSLINPSSQTSDSALSEFIESAEFVGRLLGNNRRPSVPPFATKDSEVGYQALQGGLTSFADHFRSWLQENPPPPIACRTRDLIGWAAEHLLTQDDDLDSEVDDVPNQLLLKISDIIRSECQRVLHR
jgi:hypothetical protein